VIWDLFGSWFLVLLKRIVMNFIMRIIVTSIVAFGLSYLLSDGVHIDKFTTAIILAIVLAILNAIIKPLLIILTFPITLVTFGLFLFVINALIILMADKLLRGFGVDGFWWALLFSLLLSIVTSLLYKEKRDEKDA
jgi:putative membrane protein